MLDIQLTMRWVFKGLSNISWTWHGLALGWGWLQSGYALSILPIALGSLDCSIAAAGGDIKSLVLSEDTHILWIQHVHICTMEFPQQNYSKTQTQESSPATLFAYTRKGKILWYPSVMGLDLHILLLGVNTGQSHAGHYLLTIQSVFKGKTNNTCMITKSFFPDGYVLILLKNGSEYICVLWLGYLYLP